MSATIWHFPRALPTTKQQESLPSAPAETEPCAAVAVDLATPHEGVQNRLRHSVIQGVWWDSSLDSWVFWKMILWSQWFHFLISRKALSPFMVASDPVTSRKPFVKWVLNGQEDPLEKEMTIHSSILAWEIPWTEELDGLQSMGLLRVGQDWEINTFFSLSMVLNSTFTGNLYIDLPPTVSLEQSLRAIWGAVSQAAVLTLPQIKLNLQLSSCASFLVNNTYW